MEIREKNGFSIIGFIAQVLVVLLFVFVLMWLFPTKSYLESHGIGSATANTSLNELLVNQNLLSMKDAAKEYFTVSRMPATEGEVKILSLDDMINSSMVVELTDAYGNKCNRNDSYVRVVKIGNEYEMEVLLTCGDVTKKVITTIGCYNFCESGMCEKESKYVTLYQYSKEVKGTSKWTDWSEWSKEKVTENKTTKVETKTVTEKTGTTTKIVDADAKTTYSCKEGKLEGDKCIIGTTGTKTVAADATTTYSCKEGKRDGKKCIITTKKNADAKTTYSCKEGKRDGKICIITAAKTVPATPHTTYTCSEGNVSGATCVITEYTSAIPHIKVSFNCSAGPCVSESKIDYYYCKDSSYTLSGTTCYKNTYVAATPHTTYTCSQGSVSGSQCNIPAKTVPATATTTYSCKEGTRDGKICIITTTVDAIAKTTYSCKEGTLSGKNCIITTSGTKLVDADATTTYSCKEGKRDGKKCIITTDKYEEVTYYRFKKYVTTKDTIVYKWSKSKNDTALLKAGYKLTGVTKTQKVK